MNSGHSSFIKAIQRGGMVSVASEISLGTALENFPLVLDLLKDMVLLPLASIFFFQLLNILCRSRMPSFTSKKYFSY